jgi:hypothetical protein
MKRLIFILSLCCIAASAMAQERKPDLSLLLIGINRYYNMSNLRFAKQNTKTISNVFQCQQKKAFNNIYIRQVLDDTKISPTYKNITENLEFLKQVKQDDVAIFYYSGHGEIDKTNGHYYLLPSDTALNADETINFSTTISMNMIKEKLNSSAINIIFIESCYSEAAIKELRDTNTIIFASSRENEVSYEASLLFHDIVTVAISEGMSGKAADNGKISAESLSKYIYDRVIALSEEGKIKGIQHPVAYIPEQLKGFVLGVSPGN